MTPRERKTLVDATSPTTNYTSRRTPRKWQWLCDFSIRATMVKGLPCHPASTLANLIKKPHSEEETSWPREELTPSPQRFWLSRGLSTQTQCPPNPGADGSAVSLTQKRIGESELNVTFRSCRFQRKSK
jgi:hypothetical protein